MMRNKVLSQQYEIWIEKIKSSIKKIKKLMIIQINHNLQ